MLIPVILSPVLLIAPDKQTAELENPALLKRNIRELITVLEAVAKTGSSLIIAEDVEGEVLANQW